MKEDIEREYLKEQIFAQERASLLEQEYYEYLRLPAKVTAQITYKKFKKNETKHNTSPLPRISEESV